MCFILDKVASAFASRSSCSVILFAIPCVYWYGPFGAKFRPRANVLTIHCPTLPKGANTMARGFVRFLFVSVCFVVLGE